MNLQNMADEMAIVATIDPDAYGTGDQTSDVVDMKYFREVLFIVMAGTLGSSATLDFKVYGSTVVGMSSAALITGKEVTQLTEAGTDSDKQAIIRVTQEEVMAQGLRFIRATMSVGTATSDAGAIALGFGLRYNPATEYDLTSVDEVIN